MSRVTISEKEDHVIIVKCTEQAAKECLLSLLSDIKYRASHGHSFDIIVDPGIEIPGKYFMDGDGAAHIRHIWDNGLEYDDFSELRK